VTADLPNLTDRDRARAEQLGVSEEQMRAHKAVERAKVAATLGLTPSQYAELEALADQADATGRGVKLADWAAATGRDSAGRRAR
jgi:hypothetical protein